MSTLETYKLIEELPNVGLIQFGNDGRIFEVNQGFCNLIGYKKMELMSLKITDILHPEDNIQNQCEIRFITKDKSIITCERNIRMVGDKRGRPISYACMFMKVNAPKKNFPASKNCIVNELINPITIINSKVDQIKDLINSTEDKEQVISCAEKIATATNRILHIIQSMEGEDRIK